MCVFLPDFDHFQGLMDYAEAQSLQLHEKLSNQPKMEDESHRERVTG